MSATMLIVGSAQVPADFVTPASQSSVNSETVLVGSELNAGLGGSVAYTFIESGETNGVIARVYGAFDAEFSDEVQVGIDITVDAAGVDSYSATPPPFLFYRTKILSQTAGAAGVIVLRGLAR